MTLKISIAFLFSVLLIQSYSQVDFSVRKQKLKPAFIDTTKENIFVYEVPNAILYFKQDDIQTFINNPSNKNILTNYGYKVFVDTLAHKTQKIKITDYHFSYDQTQLDSIFKQQPEI